MQPGEPVFGNSKYLSALEWDLLDAAEDDLHLGRATIWQAAKAMHEHITSFIPEFKRSVDDIALTMIVAN
jgi:hypothetical protein